MTNDFQIPDVNDSSDLPDDARGQFTVVGRPKGSILRQRHHSTFNESAADYTDLFRSLQIRPELHERFLEGILKVVRTKNIKELQKGTEASIRGLSRLLLRGYRTIVWKEGSEWLLEDRELDEGEERLLHGGDNNAFYPLLEPIWWRMRELVFEVRPPPKTQRGRKRKSLKGGVVEDAYEADMDTELDTRTPVDRAREQTLRRINKLITTAQEPNNRLMSADETDKAIFDLVVRLANIRESSDPEIFQQLWDQHIGRIDELDNNRNRIDLDEGIASAPVAATSNNEQVDSVSRTSGAAVPIHSSLSNEPSATAGNPLPQSFPRPLPAQVPALMAVYITTAPPESPYTQQAYEWLDAPVRMVDQTAFYNGLILRVKMPAKEVKGLVMSYGWCDVCRWTSKGTAGEREGWSVLQRDLAWAAGRGVSVWRMKVLVVGSR